MKFFLKNILLLSILLQINACDFGKSITIEDQNPTESVALIADFQVKNTYMDQETGLSVLIDEFGRLQLIDYKRRKKLAFVQTNSNYSAAGIDIIDNDKVFYMLRSDGWFYTYKLNDLTVKKQVFTSGLYKYVIVANNTVYFTTAQSAISKLNANGSLESIRPALDSYYPPLTWPHLKATYNIEYDYSISKYVLKKFDYNTATSSIISTNTDLYILYSSLQESNNYGIAIHNSMPNSNGSQYIISRGGNLYDQNLVFKFKFPIGYLIVNQVDIDTTSNRVYCLLSSNTEKIVKSFDINGLNEKSYSVANPISIASTTDSLYVFSSAGSGTILTGLAK